MHDNIKKEAREMATKKFRRTLSTYEQSVLDLLDSDLESILDCGERTSAASDMLDSVLESILRCKTNEAVHLALVEKHAYNDEQNPLYMADVGTAIKRTKQATSEIVRKGRKGPGKNNLMVPPQGPSGLVCIHWFGEGSQTQSSTSWQ